MNHGANNKSKHLVTASFAHVGGTRRVGSWDKASKPGNTLKVRIRSELKSLLDKRSRRIKSVSKSSKSVRYDVSLKKKYTGKQFSRIVEKAADELNVYISHIGGYSRVKYPSSIHWHFKEHPKEKGCLDATFWEEGNEFWIVARNYEPQWVKDKAVELQKHLNKILT